MIFREPAGDGDWEQYAIAAAEAFGGKRDAWTAFVEPMRANGRALVAVDGGRVVAGATVLPVAQHFGGRPVRSGAISNVFVLPGHRGQGLSGAVLDGLGPLLAGAGPVSVLSTGSPGVYRPHDWEIGGVRAPVTIPGRVLAELGPAGGTLVREPALAERAPLAARLAAAWDGPMSRPAWWEKLTEVWLGARPAQRAGWREGGRLTGWLAVEPRDDRLVVSEWWTSTPDAVAGLAGFLGAGRPFPKEVRFDTGTLPPDAELLHTLRAWDVRGGPSLTWMQRLIDPAAALAARGWPPGAELRAELEITSARRPAERLVLEIGDGEAAVTAGGAGTVRAGAGALAAWYAGGLRLRRAAALGWVTGPEPVLAALDAATGDRVAWLPERF